MEQWLQLGLGGAALLVLLVLGRDFIRALSMRRNGNGGDSELLVTMRQIRDAQINTTAVIGEMRDDIRELVIVSRREKNAAGAAGD